MESRSLKVTASSYTPELETSRASMTKQFYQLDTSHTRKHGDSGLGLTIYRGYVGVNLGVIPCIY